MNTKSQLACAWASAVAIALLIVGWGIISGYVPPRHADASAQAIAEWYGDNTDRIRIGLLLTFVAWAGWGALIAVLAIQLARVEGKRPVLSVLQLASGVAGWACLLIPTMLLGVATFRPERSPEITQTLHDLGWITAFFPITPFIVQAVCIAVVVLRDESSDPPFPRWLGYANLWAGLLFAPGGLLLFFKTGPFAYHGLMVFWIPLIVFGAWILLLSWAARRAVLHEARA